jgi:two-component system OmpR family sensor kinase
LPIAAQVLLLLLAGLLAAQVATVLIAILLPPRRAAFRLDDIAAALRDGPLPIGNGETLVRTHQTRPPATAGAGWVTLPRVREDLARVLGVPLSAVQVQFFVAPPFAGASIAPPPAPPPGPANHLAVGLPYEGARQSVPAATEDLGPPPWMERRGPEFRQQHFGPWVDGAFIAALRTGRTWTVIQPAPPRFLSSWERRVLLWFALSFAVIGPIGYLFARRLTAPLAAFSLAAERLGRDVRAPPVSLVGPAELKRAARALNGMQVRLQRHVDDRTAMIGAISHDLRTPLARLKFRLERVAAETRAPMLADINQMEAMLAAVLTFIRDASEPGVRERVDLRSILECVVDDAALMGADASLERGDTFRVEVDPTAIQRVVTNLLDNALKYGGEARVSLQLKGDEVVVQIADAGPGLAPDEFGRVFEPFYRSGPARTLDGQGVGLGLSIARSIARAHGGEVELRPAARGLIAELRLPAPAPILA